MSHRKTISREFFSTIAVVLILGLSVMCAIQTALSAAYFVNERRTALTAILDGASALSQRFAEGGSIVTRPLGDERAQDARSGFELFNTTSGALVFVASAGMYLTPARWAASLKINSTRPGAVSTSAARWDICLPPAP